MSEVKMVLYHGYHMQSDGVICQRGRRGHILQPIMNGPRLVFKILRDNDTALYPDAYKLFYSQFADKKDIPDNLWSKDCEVYPINGFPYDFNIDNLELITLEMVSNQISQGDIGEIFKLYHSHEPNITTKTIANKYNVTENTIKFVLKRYGRRKIYEVH
jgi:hypothetical protein